jgi:ABC-type sugar transport system permease subunit
VVLGLLLLLPAALCCGTSLLAPTVQTFMLGQEKANALSQPVFVGGANYAQLAQLAAVRSALNFSLEVAVLRLAAVAVAPLLLALGAAALGRWTSGGLRLLFTLPLVLFAPAALAAAWLITRTAGNGALGSVARAQGTVLLIDLGQTLAIATALGVIAYLAALRGRPGGLRSAAAPLAVIWGVSMLVALASGLQTFAVPQLLTGGGPAAATTPLMLLIYRTGFQQLQLGLAGALSSVVLAVLAVLGILAGLALVVSGARFEHITPGEQAARPMPAVLGALIVVVLGLTALGLWLASFLPVLRTLPLALGGGVPAEGPATDLNSLIGPAGVLLVALPLAYLGGLGIGALRPLGRWSNWLLLPFSPWLLVTLGPLSVAYFIAAHDAGVLNTVTGLASPLFLGVPLLFAMTLFFSGRAGRWAAARAAGRSALGAFFGEVILPSLPFALLVGVIAVLASGQELLWPLLAASRPELATANVALAQLLERGAATNSAALARAVWAALLPSLIFGLVALGLLQVLYVGRLAVRTGGDE